MGGHQDNAMDDVRLQQLLQEAEEHLRARSCRGIWFGDDKRAA